jgi:hypothetical protein
MKDIAWGHYEDNDTDKTIEVLKTIKGGAYPDHRDEIRSLLRLFKQRYVEYLVAPYLEQSQVSHFLVSLDSDGTNGIARLPSQPSPRIHSRYLLFIQRTPLAG